MELNRHNEISQPENPDPGKAKSFDRNAPGSEPQTVGKDLEKEASFHKGPEKTPEVREVPDKKEIGSPDKGSQDISNNTRPTEQDFSDKNYRSVELADNKLEGEVKSQFSRENFKIEDSYDYFAKSQHPELNELKSKCVYDVPQMGTPDSEINRTAKAEYTNEERDYIKDIRNNVDAPTPETKMQKVIGVDTGDIDTDLKAFLHPTTLQGIECEAQVYGYVAKANDVVPFTQTPQECFDNLRLDYNETAYRDPNQSVYAVRFTDGDNYSIPYGEQFGGERSFAAPNTENGYLGGKDCIIPEYTVCQDEKGKGAIITGGEIYRINPEGSEDPVAYFDKKRHLFRLYEGEAQ